MPSRSQPFALQLLAPDLLFTRTPGFVSLANFFASLSQLAVLYTVPVCTCIDPGRRAKSGTWINTDFAGLASVKGLSNTNAGLHLIPCVIATSSSSLLTGWWMSKVCFSLPLVCVTELLLPIPDREVL